MPPVHLLSRHGGTEDEVSRHEFLGQVSDRHDLTGRRMASIRLKV